jgi:hypothetical protein
MFAFWTPESSGGTNPLTPVVPARDAIQLEVTFVERPLGDPLLGTQLWSGIDQVGAVARKEEREALNRLGLQVGNAGAAPCPALEQMLELNKDAIAVHNDSIAAPVRQVFYVEANQSPAIQANSHEECAIDVPTLSGVAARNYTRFQGVLRITARRLQDGWVQIDFTPEIHHGERRWRPVASSSGWQGRDTPEIDALLAHRFSMRLHVGEMAVITGDSHSTRSFGHQCFVAGEASQGEKQRLLVVRVADMAKIEPVHSASQGALPAKR